mgnify:FL=1
MKLKLILLMLSSAALTGCGSITGFSNAKTDFGCADLSGGPSCRNISQVYAENNPVAQSVPAELTAAVQDTVGERKDFVTIIPAKPWRTPETVLRVWLAPFTDKEGDLHDQRYLYVRLNNGGWDSESVQSLAASSRVSKPVYPLSSEKEPSKEEIKKEKLKQLPALGFGASSHPL